MKNDVRKFLGKRVVIAGGGPAGASLAIRLAGDGYSVVLIEREEFPRQKLCGEFISPECIDHFRALGVSDEMVDAGGDRIVRTLFYSPDGKSVDVPSDWFARGAGGALGLSRARMDYLLLKKAKESGVKVLEKTSVKELVLEDQVVAGLVCRKGDGETIEFSGDLFVDATGRAGVLTNLASKANGKKHAAGRPKWVGFKAHFSNVEMEPGRCEIYFFRGGYGGLNFVEDGRANHCFLMRADVVREFAGDADAIFHEVVMQNVRANATMRNSVRNHKWIAVAVDEFGRKELTPAVNLFSVGDSAAFIDPFTGSGMLMALESSEVLAHCLGNMDKNYASISDNYRELHQERFGRRLRLCAVMRRLCFSPWFASILIKGLQRSGSLRQAVAKATRFADSKGAWQAK